MRYFIAYLASKPLAEYHQALVKELAEKFGLEIGAGYFPTHITLKAPFDLNDATVIKDALEKFASVHYAPSFTIKNFGHFDRKVIFLDVSLNEILSTITWDLQNTLKQIHNLSWREHEPLRNFHVFVAKRIDTMKFDAIWSHLMQKKVPSFDLLFDNITLLRLENDAWVVDSVYQLNL